MCAYMAFLKVFVKRINYKSCYWPEFFKFIITPMSHSAQDEELRKTCESTVMTQLLYSRELKHFGLRNNNLILVSLQIV